MKDPLRKLQSLSANDTTATATLNANFAQIEEEIKNTLSRDGTQPNYMNADLDLNSFKIINIGEPEEAGDVATKRYVDDIVGNAREYAQEAAISASNSNTYAQQASISATNALSAANYCHTVADGILNDENIQALAADVASEDSNVKAVADNVAAINTVATNVVPIVSDVSAVASVASEVSAVGTNIASVQTAAANITAIQNAPTYAQEAKDWANKTDGTVDGSEYSAKHYAEEAATTIADALTESNTYYSDNTLYIG